MSEQLRSLLVASVVTISLLVLNLSLVISSAKASEKVKTYLNSKAGLEIKVSEEEVVGKIREYLPRRSVDYSKLKKGV